jgi:hypothetical protein
MKKSTVVNHTFQLQTLSFLIAKNVPWYLLKRGTSENSVEWREPGNEKQNWMDNLGYREGSTLEVWRVGELTDFSYELMDYLGIDPSEVIEIWKTA